MSAKRSAESKAQDALEDVVDAICDSFRRAWLGKTTPRIEDYLSGVSEAIREQLISELLRAEFDLRRRHDELLDRNDYLRRFPDQAELINLLLVDAEGDQGEQDTDSKGATTRRQELHYRRLIQEAERQAAQDDTFAHRGLRIRCPECCNAVKLDEDSSISKIVCSSCGSHFSLVSDQPDTFQAGRLDSIGQFKLLDRLGVGAFGSVWSAHDTELDRIVAIKIPRKDQLAPEDTEQFLREARATAQLNHPNIVRVYEIGREADRVYIVTDFVQGVDLADWLTEQHATPREAAQLCASIADALHHAHEHGVIHRDIKPGNIMLDMDGKPHLMDFGLAKREAGEITMTVDGKLLGTPAYMPPEQARGAAHDADARSDIYSLGMILYELLTGERPFRGSTRMLLHQVLFEDARSPRTLNSGITKDLETICLKCLEKDPSHRYQTAKDLRDDLQRLLRGEPVRARPITAVSRAWRWCKRNPLASSLTALVAGLLLTFAVLGPVVAVYQRQARTRAEEAELQTQRLLYVSDMDSAKEAWDRSDLAEMRRLIERHLPKSSRHDLRGWEWGYLWRLCKPWLTAPAGHHGGNVRDLRFTDNGAELFSASASAYMQWSVPDLTDRRTLKIDPQDVWGFSVRLSPDGKWLALGRVDGRVILVDLATGQADSPVQHESTVLSVAFSPSGEILASGDENGFVKLWSIPEGKLRSTRIRHELKVYSLEFSPDGESLATGSGDQSARLWDVKTGKLHRQFDVKRYRTTKSSVSTIAFSADGQTLAMGTSGDCFVFLWHIDRVEPTHILRGHQNVVNALAYSPDGQTLASGSGDHTLRFWDIESGQPKHDIETDDVIVALEYSPSGDDLAAGSFLGTVRLWDGHPNAEPDILEEHTDNVHCLAFSPSPHETTLASGSANGELKLWDLAATDIRARSLSGHHDQVTSVCFSPSGKTLASSSFDGTVKLWDVETGDLVDTVEHGHRVWCVAFSPDLEGTTLAWGSGEDSNSGRVDGTVTFLDRSSGSRTTRKGHRDWVFSLAFSPNGNFLASGCGNYAGMSVSDPAVRIWEVPSGVCARILEGHSGGVPSLQFSPDGTTLVTAGNDGAMKFWNVHDWTEDREITIHQADLTRVLFTPDGTSLFTSSANMPIAIWDVDSGDQRFNLPDHGLMTIMCVAISSNGAIFASGGMDDRIRLWRAVALANVQVAPRE